MLRTYWLSALFGMLGCTLMLTAPVVEAVVEDRVAAIEVYEERFHEYFEWGSVELARQYFGRLERWRSFRKLPTTMNIIGGLCLGGAVLVSGVAFLRRRTLARHGVDSVTRDVGGVAVSVGTVMRQGEEVTVLAVAVGDIGFSLSSAAEPGRGVQSGDPAFDAAVNIEGSEITARAFLTAPVRECLMRLAGNYGVTLKGGELTLRFDHLATDVAEVDAVIADLLWLVACIPADPSAERASLLATANASEMPDVALAAGLTLLAADPRRAAELQPNELKSIAADLAAGDFRGASVALGVLAGRGPALAQVVERVHPILRQRVTHTTGGGLSLAAASAGQGDVSLVDSAGDLNLLDAD